MRRSFPLFGGLMVALLASQLAYAQTAYVFDIPPQPLADSLRAVGRLTHVNVLFDPPLVDGIRAHALKAQLTADQAFALLLKGTKLKSNFLDEATVTITRDTVSLAPAKATNEDPTTVAVGAADGAVAKAGTSYRVAQNNQTSPESTSGSGNTGEGSKTGNGSALTEIIVTAQKRSERLQDVPVPVTVIDTQALAANNQGRLQDYFSTVPGLSLSTPSGAQQTLAIRGITTSDYSTPTVGLTIDDVPFGASTPVAQGSLLYPDLDPGDLERVEVLRGPQGTLYGANSMGGLIKYVTLDPTTEAVDGRLQVLGDTVDHGGLGYAVRGAVNVPLSDTLAVRVGAFTRRDPGYVDNVLTGQKNVNEVDVSGGRLSALWRPANGISLKLSALVQQTDGYGNPAVDTNALLQPTLGDLKQARMVGTEGYHLDVELYTATLKAKLADLDFISISGYGINKYSQLDDLSYLFGSLAQSLFPAATGASEPNNFETHKFTQEVRLSSDAAQRWAWIAGAFYTHERTPSDQTYLANVESTGQPVGVMADYNFPTTFEEYALFGDLTVHLTDKLDVQVGGRESENRQTYHEVDTGPLIPEFEAVPSPAITPEERTNENAFTYLLTPSYRINLDLMMYARFTSGYRVGGPNVTASLLHLPAEYGPDKTYDYELGVKGDALDKALTFDASVYYIDWRKIQIDLLDVAAATGYFSNGGGAKSEGIELSLQAFPTHGLSITGTATVDDAKLTQSFPTLDLAVGSAGDRLPYSSRFAGSLSANQDFDLPGSVTAFVGGSVSYVGSREGEFSSSATLPRLVFPAYTQTNVHTGARFKSLVVNLFINNLTDRRGIVGGANNFAQAPYYAVFIQPRTAGISITQSF